VKQGPVLAVYKFMAKRLEFDSSPKSHTIAKKKILSIGYDIETFFLFCKDASFEVSAVSLIPELENLSTWNPANQIFKNLYKLQRQKNKVTLLSKFLTLAFRYSSPLLSGVFARYEGYLNEIIKNDVQIINLSDTGAALRKILELKIDLAVVNNWWMLPEEIVCAPKYKTINIHPSALPQYRGSLPTLWSLKNNDASSAVSFMLLDKKMDSGAIIAQHEFLIHETDDSIEMEKKISKIIRENLIRDINQYINQIKIPMLQDESKKSKTAKYFEYTEIKWPLETKKEIINKVKLYPYLWPLDKCYFLVNGKKVFITQIDDAVALLKLNPGEYQVSGNLIFIAAKDGVLKLSMHQFSLKQRIHLMIATKGCWS
jgi:methionyl-tRNA formyltransferase